MGKPRKSSFNLLEFSTLALSRTSMIQTVFEQEELVDDVAISVADDDEESSLL
jgi:hypothetical protein